MPTRRNPTRPIRNDLLKQRLLPSLRLKTHRPRRTLKRQAQRRRAVLRRQSVHRLPWQKIHRRATSPRQTTPSSAALRPRLKKHRQKSHQPLANRDHHRSPAASNRKRPAQHRADDKGFRRRIRWLMMKNQSSHRATNRILLRLSRRWPKMRSQLQPRRRANRRRAGHLRPWLRLKNRLRLKPGRRRRKRRATINHLKQPSRRRAKRLAPRPGRWRRAIPPPSPTTARRRLPMAWHAGRSTSPPPKRPPANG